MFFHIVLVFLHFQALVNSSEQPVVDSTESDETKLAVAVINFKNKFNKQDDKPGRTESTSSDPREITKEVIDAFKDVVDGLLVQVSNIHHRTLLDKPTAMALNEKEKQKSYTYVFEKSDFESKVCWLIPRCLDFIYDFSTDVAQFYELYKSYYLNCVNWTYYIDNLFSWKEDIKQYSYDLDQVIKLHDFVSEYPDRSMPDGYAESAVLFVESVFERMNGIDRVTVLRTNRLVDKPKRVLGDVTENDFLNLRRKFAEYRLLNDEANSRLERKLQKLNEDFGRAISEKSPPPTVADAVNRFVTRAFKMLRAKFQSEIENVLPVEKKPSADEESSPVEDESKAEDAKPAEYSRSGFVTAVEKVFKDFCDRAPLIAIYVMGNCSDGEFAETMVPYGLQLAYCNNWTAILNTRCPRTRDARKERTCMVKTMLDRLDVSYYWTTGGEESPEHNVEHEKSASGYLSAVYGALVEHYLHRGAAQEPAFPVWSTADWMTGRFFLMYDQVKTSPYTINRDADSLPVDTSLMDLYIILMPWMASPDLAFPYRGAVTESADSAMGDFVLQHAYICKSYAKSDHKSDDAGQLKRLSESIRWYVDGAKTAREFLSFPGPRPAESAEDSVGPVDRVIGAIASLGDGNASLTGFVNVVETATEGMRERLERWMADAIEESDYADETHAVQLNRLILDNCYAAVNYVTLVHRFAYESGLGTRGTAVDMDEQYCLPYLKGIFAEQSKEPAKVAPEDTESTKVDIAFK